MDEALVGPWRMPRQMLAMQSTVTGGSIHDDKTAQFLGFDAGTIEGPTHFSQFAPLCAKIWGQRWFEVGCLSVQYKNACYAGEETCASIRRPHEGSVSTEIQMVKKDGVEVLRGSASVGANHAATALDQRLSKLKRRRATPLPDEVKLGMKSGRCRVTMAFDQKMGHLYPFSLDEKLKTITEPSTWYTRSGGRDSPWGRPIIPMEMISVLLRYSGDNFPFSARRPSVQLFANQEIRLMAGPLYVGDHYDVEHEVVAFAMTRRTESYWIKTHVYLPDGNTAIAAMLLNIASFKDAHT